MKIDDIKVGETYNVRVKVIEIPTERHVVTHAVTADKECVTIFSDYEIGSFSQAEAYPKYDPCRLFRKGDKVRVVEWNGRNYRDRDHHTELETGCIAEIWEDEKDEQEEGYVPVIYQEYIRCVPPCYLELITPVEELKPYSVKLRQEITVDDTYPYCAVVDDDGNEAARFYCEQYEAGKAKAAAEAECARLNAEYRKERS